MTTDRPRQPALSGWCLTRDHDRCVWSGCHCSCHYGTPNVVGTQRDVWDNGDSKTAPGVASTNTEGLTRSSGTSREGMAHMVATSDPARTPQGEVSCARQV